MYAIDEEEGEADEDLAEYEEGVAEIDAEDAPEIEEEEDEEEEAEAWERLRTSITEKYEEQTESANNIQV